MTTIEQRVEASDVQPDYSGREFTEAEIAAGVHRAFIGGVWDSHGQHQLDFLKSQGLRPDQKFMDVGCGCYRAGRHLVDYLDSDNYYGVDANRSLMETGYDVELTEEQRAKLPLANLRANDRFDVDFGVQFDMAIAQSVFTHVSLNHIRLCLFRMAKNTAPGGVFYATFFERPGKTPVDTIFNTTRAKPYFTEKNVFWYYRTDLQWAAQGMPWKFQYIGDWGHPAGQRMVAYTRLTDAEVAAAKAAKARGAGGAQAKPAAVTSAPKPAAGAQPPVGKIGPELRDFARRGRRWAARHIAPH